MKIQFVLFSVCLLVSVPVWAQTQTGTAGIISKTITLPGDVQLEYVEQGSPKGMPVILLHGYTDSWDSFSKVLPFLPADLHVFALSMRAHGNSSKPAAGYGPKDLAGDVAAFMKALHIGPAIIAGHSFGSLVAQQFAIDHPNKTQALVLISTLADVAANPALKAIKKFNKPTLILWGGKDQLCSRADQLALNQAIKGSQLFEYEYASHELHQEVPQQFALDLIAFSRIVKNSK